MKGLTLAEEHVRYIIGIFIAIIVVFCLWWFFFHRESDRRAEESARAFVQAVDDCCTDGEKRIAKIEMPQQAQLADFWQQLTPGGAGNEPYYYLFWESFPPEPPYNIGDIAQGNVFGSIGSIVAPWSEDLPWNSNLWMTMSVDLVSLGVDVMGIKEVSQGAKGLLGEAGSWIKEHTWDILKEGIKGKLSPDTLAKIYKAQQAIEDAAYGVAKFEGFHDPDKGIIITRDGLQIFKNKALYVTGETAAYTVFCMYYFHQELGKCATYSFISAIGTEFVARPLLQKFVLPTITGIIKDAAKEVIESVGGKIERYKSAIKFSILSDTLTSYTDDALDEVKQNLIDSGFVSEFVTDDKTGEIYGIVTKGDRYSAIMKYAEEENWPDVLDNFQFVYDSEGDTKILEQIKFKFSSWKDSIKSKILWPVNKLGELEAKVMGHNIITPDGIIQSADEWAKYIGENPENAEKIAKNFGMTVEGLTKKLTSYKHQGELGAILLPSLGSKLEGISDICERDPEDCGRSFYDFFDTLVKDKNEAKRVAELLNGKFLRLREDEKIIESSLIGYNLVKIQDLYTPLGATYWDKQMSSQSFSYAGNHCDDNEICLQMGFFVRKYPLSQSCQDVGVNNIKLDRGSLVASNPRFYLVSPCYSEVEVRRDGDTIYVKPLMCPEKGRNYCFATDGLVNWYVGAETGSQVGSCVATVLCAAGQAAITGGTGAPLSILDILKSCIGFGPGGLCSMLGTAVRTTIDLTRESLLKYPDVYDLVKNPLGDMRGDYLCDKSKPECQWCYK